MSRALIGLLVALGAFVAVAATAALLLGVDEARLASGSRHDYAAEELTPSTVGYVAVFGCVRHDLAVGVTASKTVYRLGARPPDAEDEDRVFTPLSARADCDEARPPARIYALIEDDDALGNTIGRVFKEKVAPPPVPAFVDGVIGYGAGHARLGAAARGWLGAHGVALGDAPLLQKGKRPGVRWVAITTALAGAHGYLLLILGTWWAIRRQRRAQRRVAEREHFSEQENSFLEDQE